jgi:hypothetical protein
MTFELLRLRLNMAFLMMLLENLEKREDLRERKSILGLARVSANMGKY